MTTYEISECTLPTYTCPKCGLLVHMVTTINIPTEVGSYRPCLSCLVTVLKGLGVPDMEYSPKYFTKEGKAE